MTPQRRYRCRYCGALLPAWLPAAQVPDAPMLLSYLSVMHPDQAGPYLTRMETEDIATVVVEAYAVVEASTR